MPCLLKVYENSGLDKVKLNDVIEVVGILSSDPRLTIFNTGQYEEGEEVTEEDIVNNPPASQVPRIHVLVGHKVSCYQNALDTLTPSFQGMMAKGERPDFRQDANRLVHLRTRALAVLSKALGGDLLAAEYLLMHLLTNTQREGSSQQLVGKHSLNICKCFGNTNNNNRQRTMQLVREVSEAVRALVPRSTVLPISLQKLNEKPLWPRKDYRTNRLLGGPLLLADHTHLVLDETELTTGQLQAAGLLNYNCLKHLMTFQQVEVDFQYYKLPVHCNVPTLVLSDTKSLLPCETAGLIIHFHVMRLVQGAL